MLFLEPRFKIYVGFKYAPKKACITTSSVERLQLLRDLIRPPDPSHVLHSAKLNNFQTSNI